jgi:tetratricopeptide (TPR) repeat protein
MAAKSSADPEVQTRAEAILERFKWDLYPDTPADVQKLVHDYQKNMSDGPNGVVVSGDRRKLIKQLGEKGAPGYRALYKIALADPLGHKDVYGELVWAVHVESQKWLEACVREVSGAKAGKTLVPGREPSLDGVVAALDWSPGWLADWDPDSSAYRLIRTKAVLWIIPSDLPGQPAGLQRNIPEAVVGDPAFEAAILARATGKPALAARLAERSGDRSLLKSMLVENRDWPSLWKKSQAAESAGEPTYTPLSSSEHVDDRTLEVIALGERAALARRVGEPRLFESLIGQIRQFDPKDQSQDDYRVNGLLGNGKTEDAIEVLKKAGRVDGAIDLLLLLLRYHEAIELASRPGDPATVQSWQMDLARARLWSAIGEPDKATAYFKKAYVEIMRLDDPRSGPQEEWIDAVVQASRRDLLVAQAAHWRLEAGSEDLTLLLKGLFPDSEKDANVWWRVLRVVRPGESLEKTLKHIEDLLLGHTTAAEIQSYLAASVLAKIKAGGITDNDLRLASAFAYHAMGRDDLVPGTVAPMDLSKCGQDELIRLGDLAALREDWVAAIGHYDAAWRKWPGHDDNDDQVVEKRGMSALALYLEGRALARCGQADRGKRLQELAHWLPLADENARRKFLDQLEARHEQEATFRELELASKTGEPGSSYAWAGRLGVSRSLAAKKNYELAGNLQEQLLLERMHWVFSQGFGRYLVISGWRHRNLALAHLQAGRLKECIQESEEALAAAPADVDLAITLCPPLTRAGHAAEADRLYRRMFERHKQVSAEYPRSAELHNDLAWLSVRCHRDLKDALFHARRAVELSPEHPEFIDTLAECQFQNGHQAEAIESAKRCVHLDPRRPYYRKQLARMEKGDPTAEVPAAD